MANSYPSPCDQCGKIVNGSCSFYKGCADWKTRYRYRQKQINAYARKIQIPHYVVCEPFTYEHPELCGSFLEEGPCIKCPFEPTCNFPCNARLLWWDMRMNLLRKSLGVI